LHLLVQAALQSMSHVLHEVFLPVKTSLILHHYQLP
jgi:hypothetical protein